MKTPTRFLPLAALAGLAVLALATSANAATPISGTGFSADNLAENVGATGPNAVTNYTGFARWVYPEAGTPNFPATGTAFPTASGLFTSKNGTPFQMQPLDQNNLLLNGNTFTLDTPAGYEELRFLVTGIGSNGGVNNFQANVNFDDATSSLFQWSVADWQSSRPYNASDTRFMIVRDNWNAGSYFGNGVHLRELVFDLGPADEAKAITSIDFTLANRLGLSAISGTAVAIPEPSRAAFLGLFGIALILRRRK